MKKIKIKNNIICTNNYPNILSELSTKLYQLNKFSEYFSKFATKLNINLNSLANNNSILNNSTKNLKSDLSRLEFLFIQYQDYQKSLFIYCPIQLSMVPKILMGLLDCGHYVYLPYILDKNNKKFNRCSLCKRSIDKIFFDLDILEPSIFYNFKNSFPKIISNIVELLISKDVKKGIFVIDDKNIRKLLETLIENYNFIFIKKDDLLSKIENYNKYDTIFFIKLNCETTAYIFNNLKYFANFKTYFLLDENEMLQNGEILNINNFILQKYI